MAPRTPDTPLWLLLSSYLVGLVLNTLPLGDVAASILPPFGLLLLLYWAQQNVAHTYFATATVIGLLYDAMTDTLLGLHALLFSIILFIFLRMRLRFRLVRPLQQAGVVAVLLYLYQLMLLPVTFEGLSQSGEWGYYFAMPLTALLIWPMLKRIMDWLTGTPIQHR